MNKLRFAPLVRVSEEKKEQKSESLKTQRQQIESYVKSMNGIIPDDLWKYSGQEHATPEFERKKFDQLLEDSAKDKFDALIICDASRWSRDNLKSKQGIKILKNNGIRFFIATMEYDLFNPEHSMILGLGGEINEFFALMQALKSIQNRISRAKRGLPSAGRLPFGRSFNKKTETWGLDEQKATDIQWAADQYLIGAHLPDLAKTLNMNASNLWKILTQRCGDTWKMSFKNLKVNVDETVEIKIPALLPKEMIDAIHERAASNKTYTHGQGGNKYLLSRMVFCSSCNYSMFGQTNHGKKRYYRHPRSGKVKCDQLGFYVPANDLEKAVLTHLFSMYGDISNLEKAMIKAIPDLTKIKKLRTRKETFEKELKKTEAKRQRVVKGIADGVINLTDARIQMDGIREREALLNEEIERIIPQIDNVPDEKMIKRKASLTKRTIEAIFGSYARLGKMSFQDQRKLVQSAFAGKDSQGHRLGVYVSKNEGKISYTIKGAIGDLAGKLPMTDQEIQKILGIESEVAGDYDPFKQDLKSKCYAHHGLRIYQ